MNRRGVGVRGRVDEGGDHRVGADLQSEDDRPRQPRHHQELLPWRRHHGAAVRERDLRVAQVVRVPGLSLGARR